MSEQNSNELNIDDINARLEILSNQRNAVLNEIVVVGASLKVTQNELLKSQQQNAVLIGQNETLTSENEALKKQIADLTNTNTKSDPANKD